MIKNLFIGLIERMKIVDEFKAERLEPEYLKKKSINIIRKNQMNFKVKELFIMIKIHIKK